MEPCIREAIKQHPSKYRIWLTKTGKTSLGLSCEKERFGTGKKLCVCPLEIVSVIASSGTAKLQVIDQHCR